MEEDLIQLSVEQRGEILEKEDAEEYKETLIAIRDKIVQGINRNNKRSGERAIWELMQNARDLSDAAITKIVLSRDSIAFYHQGEPFNLKTLRNLIKQQSTKNEGEDKVGQYGTGFMATHRFNKKVYISGECYFRLNEKNIYFPLPNGFCLDRSSDDKEIFIKELDNELQSIKRIVEGKGSNTPQCEWTSFKYELSSEKAEEVSEQLDITTRLMPFVLVFNDRISECTISNDISNKHIRYTNISNQSNDLSYTEKHCKVLTKIEVVEDGNPREIEIVSIQAKDGSDRIIIPPLPSGFDDVSKIPSQFLFFPLLGTENWGTNFIFHSSRLYPTEPRNSYLLPQDNDALRTKYKINEQVLDEMIEMLFEYYRNNESEQCIPIDFAKVNFAYDDEEGDEITNEYFKKLQKKFSEEFIKWKIIPTKEKYMSICDDVVVFDYSIYSGNIDNLEEYVPIISRIASQLRTIPKENIIAWSDVVHGWDATNDSYYIKLDEICESIKEKSDDLKQFLLFLKKLGEIGIDMMAKNALIPNRKGELRTTGNLRNGETITKELYEIASPIIGPKADKLVDENYSCIVELNEYTRGELNDEVISSIQELRKLSIGNTPPKLLENLENVVSVEQLIKYCSAFKIPNPTDYRAKLMPIICKFYEVDYKNLVIPSQSDDEPNLFGGSAYSFLVDNTMLMLSQKPQAWLTTAENREENCNLLIEFLNVFTDTEDKDRLEKLDKYGILPNQLGELHLGKDLQSKDSEDDDLQQLYCDIFGKDLKSIFVDERFKNFYDFEVSTWQKIGNEIETFFNNNGYDGNEVLTIIRELNKNRWKEIFPNIFARKEELYYTHGSPEERELLYRIQMKGKEKMGKVADLMDDPHFDEIINEAQRIQEQREEKERQFKFTFAIGKLIEDKIREEVNEELQVDCGDDVVADDIQYGQDIVILYKGMGIYYIECKAKWNFYEPAHMSSAQIKQAVRQKENYALCCIDCTETGCKVPPDADEEMINRSSADILQHTYVHTNIVESFEGIIRPIVSHEDDRSIDNDSNIRVYSSLSCNIPKKVFTKGVRFDEFMFNLKDILKNKIEKPD